MRDFLFANEHAAFLQQLNDDGVGFEHRLALIFRQAFDEATVVVLRRVGFQPVFLAGAEVVRAVARSGVHDSATLIERDVIREHAGNVQIQERVLKFDSFEFRALPVAVHRVHFDFEFSTPERSRALLPAAIFPRTYPQRRIRTPDETRERDWQAASRAWWSR